MKLSETNFPFQNPQGTMILVFETYEHSDGNQGIYLPKGDKLGKHMKFGIENCQDFTFVRGVFNSYYWTRAWRTSALSTFRCTDVLFSKLFDAQGIYIFTDIIVLCCPTLGLLKSKYTVYRKRTHFGRASSH